MATNTTNFSLVKPAYTDTADIADINGNMDKVDVSLNGLADAIAIVANNNTHAAITTGQYVYVHGHGSLAEGLYTAKSNISANATLSTSNLQADGSGGLNALNSNMTPQTVSLTLDKVTAYGSPAFYECSGICFFNALELTLTENVNRFTTVGTVPTGYRPPVSVYIPVIGSTNGEYIQIGYNGGIQFSKDHSSGNIVTIPVISWAKHH